MLPGPTHVWLVVDVTRQDSIGGQDHVSGGEIKSTDKVLLNALPLVIEYLESPCESKPSQGVFKLVIYFPGNDQALCPGNSSSTPIPSFQCLLILYSLSKACHTWLYVLLDLHQPLLQNWCGADNESGAALLIQSRQ